MKVWRFNVPFVRPLVLKGVTHTIREGVLLLRDGQWAEASPLPGFSRESIDDVVAFLSGEQTVGPLKKDIPASLDFALASLGTPIQSRLEVPFNRLLMGDREQVVSGAANCNDGTCSAVKLKVGRGELEADIELVRQVHHQLSGVRLRLDANQAWSFDEAVEFVEALKDIEWEYIEEPLDDSSRLEELYSKTGVRYALDESLIQNAAIEQWPNVAALICKPTILGSQAIGRLAETGKPMVFSAAFETGVGISRVMQLASKFSPQIPAGLDTLDWLAEDVLLNSPKKGNGLMTADSVQISEAALDQMELI